MHYEKLDGGPVCIEDELPFKLPTGWAWTRLKTPFLVQLGKMLDKQKNEGNKKPYLRNANVQWHSFDLSDIGMMRFADSELDKFRLAKGDLVVCEGGQPGRCAIWRSNSEIYFQKALERVRGVCKESNIWWLLNVMEAYSVAGFLEGYFTGTTIKHLPAQALGSLLVPVPPIAEQRRVVVKLDELLSLIDDIERSQAELEELFAKTRSKVLDLAIRGKLVPQDPADEPASVLLERIHQEKLQMVADGRLKKKDVAGDSVIYRGEDNSYYEKVGGGTPICVDDELPFELPGGWEWTRLGSVCKYLHRGKSPKYSEMKLYPVFAQKCNQPTYIALDRVLFADPDTFGRYGEECFLDDFDIVVNSTGTGTLGRVGVFKLSMLRGYPCIVPDSHITVIRAAEKQLSLFIAAFLRSDYGQSLIFRKQTGSTNQKELPTREVAAFLLPVPPENELARIESAVAEASSFLDFS